MPLLPQAAQTLTSSLALPSQPNSLALNCVPSAPSSGSKAMPRPMVPNTVPSRGAALASQFASRRLPAPSMFFGTTTAGRADAAPGAARGAARKCRSRHRRYSRCRARPCVPCRNPGPGRSPPARRARGRSSMPASCVSSARHNATMIIDFDSHLREGYFMDEVYRFEGPYERFRPVKMNDGRTHNTKFVHSLDPISPQGHAAHRHPYIYDPKTNWRGGDIAARQVGGYDMARRREDIRREGIDKQLIF